MKKHIIYGLLLLSLSLLLCGGRAAEPPKKTAVMPPQVASTASWANVRDYGAVGDAVYHHPLGKRSGEWIYWVGHFSQMSTARYHIPYVGQAESPVTYQVVPDSVIPSSRQVRLSEVNPGSADYKPSVGDIVAAYTAADLEASVPATDDSVAFEQAIAAGNGYLYLPEGSYMISQLTAAKIKNIQGPGTIWLKEWRGGSVYYLAAGILSDALIFNNYGWINTAYFHNDIWRDMHWVTCLPQVYGWKNSEIFSGNLSPRMEFAFDENRDNLNMWLTVHPATAEKDFPDSVTICISNASANYTEKGQHTWRCASGDNIGGGMFHPSWNGTNAEIPSSAWKNCGDWIEITLKKEDFFRHNEKGGAETWAFHCWTLDNQSLSGKPVEFVCSTAQVWVKDAEAAGCLMCDVGSDMRTTWENREVKEGYILEACDSGSQLLTDSPRRFYAYTVPDSAFSLYLPFPK